MKQAEINGKWPQLKTAPCKIQLETRRADNGRKNSTMLATDKYVPITRAGAQGRNLQAMLTRERRRAERSRKPFVLMLLERHRKTARRRNPASGVAVGWRATRETDLVGWYKQSAIVGVIFTEVGSDENDAIAETLCAKIGSRVSAEPGPRDRSKDRDLLALFPGETGTVIRSGWLADSKLYPDLEPQGIPEDISARHEARD